MKKLILIAMIGGLVLMILSCGGCGEDTSLPRRTNTPKPNNSTSNDSAVVNTKPDTDANGKPILKELPPEPVLEGEPPVKPDFKALFYERLKTPDKYASKWHPPLVGDEIEFFSTKGVGHDGYLVEAGYDFIKIKDKNLKPIFTYRKKSMKLEYRLKYLKEDFIKNEVRQEILVLVAEYNAAHKAYMQPKTDWQKEVDQIESEYQDALAQFEFENDIANADREAKAAEKRKHQATVKACGPEPSMTIIGWTQTVPLIVKIYLKQALHDYDSFDKVNGELLYTKYKGVNCWVWKMTYRARNGFGGKVINTNKFYIRNDRLLGVE